MLSDTHPEAERLQIELLRRATASQRLAMMRSMTTRAVQLSRRAIAEANPGLTDREVDLLWVELHYGRDLAQAVARAVREEVSMQNPDIVAALAPVVRELERLKVRYYIGGSVASSAYGHSRTTQDVDVVAELAAEHIHPLVEALRSTYYVSETAIVDAVARKSCFNVVHYATAFKVDIFVTKDRAFDRAAFSRVCKRPMELEGRSAEFFFASPEDLILSKLEWFRLGDEVSQQQWRDIHVVLRVQKESLDRGYLEKWAAELGVADLLEKAWREATV